MKANYEESNVPLSIDTIRSGEDRSLAFINLEKLSQMTGVTSNHVVKFTITEMLYNALDKDSNTITISLTKEGKFYVLRVSDNGSKKLSEIEIEKILNFNINGSSKRGLKIISRGSIGNALKCIVGFSYALAKERDLPIQSTIIESGSFAYVITLDPNVVEIKKKIVSIQREDDGLTYFVVKFPHRRKLRY